MANLRTIEIDFDVHKRIELERQSFAETPNAVLRRLLQIGGQGHALPTGREEGRPWAGKGVTLPHGTELRMEYNGRVHTGIVQNGAWLVEGGEYKSPSGAADGVARTKDGRRASLDGWEYWQVKRPGDIEWIAIDQLRDSMTHETLMISDRDRAAFFDVLVRPPAPSARLRRAVAEHKRRVTP